MEKTVKAPKDGWGKIQREALIHLKGNDFRVYSALSTYANTSGQCYPAVETLAKVTGITPRNIQKHLANLERNGWIEKHLRTNTSTIYQLFYVKVSKPSKNPPKQMSKIDVPEVSKIDVAGTSEFDVGGVSKIDVLTDHLTDHNNKPQEQVVSVVPQKINENEERKYELTGEQRLKFNTLYQSNHQEGESKSSALSAYSKYCEIGDPKLMHWISSKLDKSTGTFMTNQMKQIYADYQVHLREVESTKEFELAQLQLPPECRL